jgi:hypothetical protein
MAAVACTSVADEHCLLLDGVAALSVGGAWIDRVLVVETAARSVAFDDLIAHLGGDGYYLSFD